MPNLEITSKISMVLLGSKLVKSISLSRFIVFCRNNNENDIKKYYETDKGIQIFGYIRQLT